MTFLVMNGTVISAVYDSVSHMSVERFLTKKGISYTEILDVPTSSNFSGLPGQDIREFDTSYTQRPLSERVSEGLVTVPPEDILDGEKIRPKTWIERFKTGLDEIPTGWKIDEEGQTLIEKTPVEKLQDGEVTLEKSKELLLTEVRIIASNAIYASYPMTTQQNLLEECMYGSSVIACERNVSSDAVMLEMNLLVVPLTSISSLVSFRQSIPTLDLSGYLLEPSGDPMSGTTRSRSDEYYRTILKSLVCRRLKYYVREWCRSKEVYIGECTNVDQLAKLDMTTCPTI